MLKKLIFFSAFCSLKLKQISHRNPGGEAPWNATGTWKWEDDTNWEFSNWFSGM